MGERCSYHQICFHMVPRKSIISEEWVFYLTNKASTMFSKIPYKRGVVCLLFTIELNLPNTCMYAKSLWIVLSPTIIGSHVFYSWPIKINLRQCHVTYITRTRTHTQTHVCVRCRYPHVCAVMIFTCINIPSSQSVIGYMCVL